MTKQPIKTMNVEHICLRVHVCMCILIWVIKEWHWQTIVLILYAFPFPSFIPILKFSRETESMGTMVDLHIYQFILFSGIDEYDYGRISRSETDKLKTQESQWLGSRGRQEETYISAEGQVSGWAHSFSTTFIILFRSTVWMRSTSTGKDNIPYSFSWFKC